MKKGLESKKEADSLRDENIFKNADKVMENIKPSKAPPTLITWTKILRMKMGDLPDRNPLKGLLKEEICWIDQLEKKYLTDSPEYEAFIGEWYSRLEGLINLDAAKERYFILGD